MRRFLIASVALLGAAPTFAAEPGEKPWAYRRPEPQPTPVVTDTAWAREPLDPFVLVKLEGEERRG